MIDQMYHRLYDTIMQRLVRRKQMQANQRFQSGRECRPNSGFSHLESLPLELLQLVLDQLDHVSLVCLKNTTSRFRALIPVEEKNLSRCQKWLIMCRFETDMQDYPELVACAFCKVKRSQKDFGVISTINRSRFRKLFQQDRYSGIEHLSMMSSKPVERYCYRHLTSCLGWPPAFQNAEQIKWVHTLEPTCLHCGSKPASCGQSEVKFYDEIEPLGHCNRLCDVCPTAYLSTISRHGPIRSFWFISGKGGFICCLRRTYRGTLAMAELQGKKWCSVLGSLTEIFGTLGYYAVKHSNTPLSNENPDSRRAHDEGWSCVR